KSSSYFRRIRRVLLAWPTVRWGNLAGVSAFQIHAAGVQCKRNAPNGTQRALAIRSLTRRAPDDSRLGPGAAQPDPVHLCVARARALAVGVLHRLVEHDAHPVGQWRGPWPRLWTGALDHHHGDDAVYPVAGDLP